MKNLLAAMAAALAFCLTPAGSLAQGTGSATATTPTTKILAIGTLTPGTKPAAARAILPDEVRETVELYLDGKIEQWYSLQGRPGAVFVLNVTNEGTARAMLEALPLGKARFMHFELIPLGPLGPLRQLQGMRTPPESGLQAGHDQKSSSVSSSSSACLRLL